MKRAGFTMIELIFVIVILGILAAVAVPKLAATRTDAAATAAFSDWGNAVKSIATNVMATGAINADITTVVNTTDALTVTATAVVADSGGTDCVTGTITGNNLVITVQSIAGNCAIFTDVVAESVPLLGSTVTR